MTFTRILSKNVISSSVRRFSASAAPSGKTSFRPKTTSEIWLGDAGAYPVMSVIAFAVFFATGAGLYLGWKDPDARVFKSSRKNSWRGEMKYDSDATH